VGELAAEVREAARRIERHVVETPLWHSVPLSRRAGAEVFLKLENLQHTGSFKVRGALHKVLSLDEPQRRRGVVAASTGNHGLAVAYAASIASCPATVYLPEGAAAHKVARLRDLAVDLCWHGTDCEQTERFARQRAAATGRVFVSPYNDPAVIAGQGTVARELARQLGRAPDVCFVAVGGGGLMAGVGTVLRELRADVRLVGCWPARSPVLYQCLQAGRIVPWPSQPTLSDATAGGVEPDAVTFDLCRELIDEAILVREEEIRRAMQLVRDEHGLIIEGAAGVALAGLLRAPGRFAGQTAVVVLCGRNVAPAELARAAGPAPG
jgi:threonine dehydratase